MVYTLIQKTMDIVFFILRVHYRTFHYGFIHYKIFRYISLQSLPILTVSSQFFRGLPCPRIAPQTSTYFYYNSVSSTLRKVNLHYYVCFSSRESYTGPIL